MLFPRITSIASFVVAGIVAGPLGCSGTSDNSPQASPAQDAGLTAQRIIDGGANEASTTTWVPTNTVQCPSTSATCTVAADCAAKLSGVAGCWSCEQGCCVAIETGKDPSNACGEKHACSGNYCDGSGGCAEQQRPEGTECGSVCYGSEVHLGKCASGACMKAPGGQLSDPSFVDACGSDPRVRKCQGDGTGATSCPESGCSAHCQ